MDKSQLISMLEAELAQNEQEATRLKQIIEEAKTQLTRLESLSVSIRATIEGICDRNGQKPESNLDDSGLSAFTHSSNGTVQNGSHAETHYGDGYDKTQPAPIQDLTSQEKYIRTPKDYQRLEYKGRGYIQIAQDILKKHSEGLHIGQLVEIIFEYQSTEEFSKAKKSLQTELTRAVKENRLGKEEDYYFPCPKLMATQNVA
ncbi:MAG: hypothetical protein J7647_14205 [Cyanobacteria bacterium SBLK]|nr:hypothetical protein [Cyanobacteria bacterium SBLK]